VCGLTRFSRPPIRTAPGRGPTSITSFEAGGVGYPDYFVEVLTILCRDSAAVTIHPLDGEPFGVVLVSNDAKTLVYESLDKGTGQPGGEPMTIDVDQIDELPVF
jgi:hypothetical protein